MRFLGHGSQLWWVDFVFWGVPEDDALQDRLLARVDALLGADDGVPSPLGDTRVAMSYDMQPPGGSIGVGFWVRADSVVAALAAGWEAVAGAVSDMAGVQVWDIRLLPRNAIRFPGDDWPQ